MKKGKITLNTKLERHMVEPHALSRKVSTYIPKIKTIQPNYPNLNHIQT